MTKPRSKATVNPTSAQKIDRHVGRIKTLRIAIEQSEARGNAEKTASLTAELEGRLAEVAEYRSKLDEI